MRFKQEDLAGMTAKPAAERKRVVKTSPVVVEALAEMAKLTPFSDYLPPSQRPPGKAKLQALGRLKPGEMNKTEKRFLNEWISPRMQSGELVWWGFEAITLKLAPDCRLTVDFFVMTKDGALQAWDVKGSFAIASDDFMVKARMAASMFPWPFFMVAPRKKAGGGGWDTKEF